MNEEQRVDHFTISDRQTLIELGVDMRYIKAQLAQMERDNREDERASKSDLKDVWVAIDDLRMFRWWMAGYAAAVATIISLLVSYFSHKP